MAVDMRTPALPAPRPAPRPAPLPAAAPTAPTPQVDQHAPSAPPAPSGASAEPDLAALSVPLPPLVRGAPLLGSALAIFRDPVALFVRLYREVGPVFRLRVPGRAYTVMVGPEATLFLARGGDEAHFTERGQKAPSA